MNGKRRLVSRGSVGLSAVVLLTAALLPGAADAVTTTGSGAGSNVAACTMDLGSVTPGGDHRSQRITATSPPTRTNDRVVAADLYDDPVRLSGSMLAEPDPGGVDVSGYVVIGETLSRSSYRLPMGGEVDPDSVRLGRIGGGWGGFVAFEESRYQEFEGNTFGRTATYGLRSDGVLFRWTPTSAGWRSTGSAAGFASVKTMALISKTRTYDTFLANLKGGALYTIHLPTTSPMKPVVKPVRTRSWQGFEFLIAQKCGVQGTLLLGIDKDTQSAYLYAVGHATGTTTVIQSLGKVPGTYSDPVYFRWTLPIDALFGE